MDTIGGWFLSQKFDATTGTEVEYGGYIFRVQKNDGPQIHYLEVQKN